MFKITLNKQVIHKCDTLKESIDKWLEIASSKDFRRDGGSLDQWHGDTYLGGTTLTNTGEKKSE